MSRIEQEKYLSYFNWKLYPAPILSCGVSQKGGGPMASRAKISKASQALRQKAVNHRTGLPLMLTDEVRGQIEGVIAASIDSFATEVLGKLVAIRQTIARPGTD